MNWGDLSLELFALFDDYSREMMKRQWLSAQNTIAPYAQLQYLCNSFTLVDGILQYLLFYLFVDNNSSSMKSSDN